MRFIGRATLCGAETRQHWLDRVSPYHQFPITVATIFRRFASSWGSLRTLF